MKQSVTMPMKVILMSVGTRGDMEPFLAMGELLKEKGHRVICAFPEQFKDLAKASNLEFASLGSKYIDLLESPDGRAAMGGASGFKKIMGTIKLALNQGAANKELLHKQQQLIDSEAPDRLLYNGKAVYPVLWGLRNKGKTVFISPVPYMHYVKGHTHVAFNSNFGVFFNKLTFALAEFGMIAAIRISQKWLSIHEKLNRKDIREMLRHNRSVYTISPSLFSKPDCWDENLKVLGYHVISKKMEWQPDKALTDFLEKHDKILFITFGSMINPAPEEKTRMFLDILERNRIPAIVNTASGGLVKPDKYDAGLIHFVTRLPYEWVLPRVYGIIHHGGSGTTHLALKHGCATMIVPHIIDQFVWNKIIHDKGIGPKGIKIGKISTKNLEPRILELMNDQKYKRKAEQIKIQMAKEDYKEELYDAII